ncbi:MAG TPA: protein kinase, partial [Thermoanaerobaculia bacterium]
MIAPTSLEDRITKILGDRYELIELLGKGGFASVFRVRSRRLGRTEALKVLSESLTEDSDFAKRFEQEARVAASLDHPQIVKVYDYGAAEDFVWFSMQYVDGPSVGRELRMRESFDELSTARIAVGVLDALQYSHARGVIHRDIKPDNILLDREGRPYLTDFGVAKSQVALVKTHAGTLLGSPAYMSPEQLQGKPLDGRSDLYSLGVTLYKMLAGGLPFTADDTFRATMKRLSEPPEPLSTRRPEVNAMLAEIVMRSLERDVTLRYPDAEAMREDLQSFLQDVTPPRVRLSASAVRGDSPTPTGVTMRTPSRATPLSTSYARTPTPRATTPPPPPATTPTATPMPPQPPAPAGPRPEPPAASPPPPASPVAKVASIRKPLPIPKLPRSASVWITLAIGVSAVVAIALFARRPKEAPATQPAPARSLPSTPVGAIPTLPAPTAVAAVEPTPEPTEAPAVAEEPTPRPSRPTPRPTRRVAPVPTAAVPSSAEPTLVPMGPARPPKSLAEMIAVAPLSLAPEFVSRHHNESVGLSVTVGADGTVKSAKVISEVCPECDRAALEAIRRSRFKPAMDA